MEAYALTDIGRVRTMNQDYIYSSPEKVGSLPNLFLVADGMGGHRAGDYASRFAVENLVIYINRAGDGSPVMQLKRGIEAVNGMLYEESLKREELKGMGCTLVAGVVEDNILYVANVGSVDPATSGKNYELYAIAGVVIGGISMSGGKGRILGVVFGSMSFTIIDKIITALGLNPLINDTIKGAILLLAIAVQMLPMITQKLQKTMVTR